MIAVTFPGDGATITRSEFVANGGLNWAHVPGTATYFVDLRRVGTAEDYSRVVDPNEPLVPYQPNNPVCVPEANCTYVYPRFVQNIPAGSYAWRVEARDATPDVLGTTGPRSFTLTD